MDQLTSLAPAPAQQEQVELAAAKMVACPSCGAKQQLKTEEQKCAVCKQPLTGAKYAQAPQESVLNLSESVDAVLLHLTAQTLTQLNLTDNAGLRQQWAKDGKALPDGSWPIPDVAHLKKAIQAFPGRAKGQEGRIKAWILKRAKALNYSSEDLDKVEQYGGGSDTDDKKMAQPEHNASIVALQLDHTAGEHGLIWKVLCKTGTLALSPGPGQMDVEKPLNLTADMFQHIKRAYDDGAFEHVTVPETHGNGTLENLGTVRHVDMLSKAQALSDTRLSQASKDSFAADPADTLYLLGGIHFTDPKAKEKAANGSILNCSVGLKFNYRRKRDGKLYPVALEHVALTNQPWVDGLGAFGGTLSQPLFDQEQLPVWDGVFITNPQNGGASSTTSLSTSTEPISLPSTMDPAQTTAATPPVTQTPAAPAASTPPEHTLESILASQQAEIERLRAENTVRQQESEQAATLLSQQGFQLHEARTNERVAELQKLGVPPGVLTRYKELRLAAYNAGEGGTLQLAVKSGDSTVTQDFDPVDQAEYLLAAMPLGDPDHNVVAITAGIGAQALSLAQGQHERKEQSAAEKADEVERSLHPERFDGEGARIPADKRSGRVA